eukprot:TRINITY_DN2492_c0_g1_i4.p1 TRINITY_DN2492_c0_g1~~TRINITY_DN2492_c0_g1_i4.p1  ORF type:complete len:201 (+),score=27.78 TRINITY_DN2492_c0_g1_i4:89-604(+)
MTFWCPENGAHTSGSNYPRSELREMPANGEWGNTGTHEMNATCKISQLPQSGKLVIGQVHADGVSGSCSIILELEMTNSDLVAHVRDKSCNNVQYTVGTGYALNTKISYQVKYQNGVLYCTTDRGSMPAYSYSWNTYPLYFKAGDYVQDNSSSSTQGGLIHFYSLTTSHSN